MTVAADAFVGCCCRGKAPMLGCAVGRHAMRHHSLVAPGLASGGLCCLHASGLRRRAATRGQWRSSRRSRSPRQSPPTPCSSPGGRVRSIGTEEIVAEIVLANASTAPGTNQITVAVDMVSPYTRSRKRTPATALRDRPGAAAGATGHPLPGRRPGRCPLDPECRAAPSACSRPTIPTARPACSLGRRWSLPTSAGS